MRRFIAIALVTPAWLLLSPTVHIAAPALLEVGAQPAIAHPKVKRVRPAIVSSKPRVIPTLPVLPRGLVPGGGRETTSDRIVRCTHQGGLGGLKPGEMGRYVHNCAM